MILSVVQVGVIETWAEVVPIFWKNGVESLGHGDAKAMFCEPLGVMKGLMGVSKNCRARHNASENICLFHKTILNAFDCV